MEKYVFEKLLGEMQNNKIKIFKATTVAMSKSKSAWEKITKILITSLIYGMSLKTWKVDSNGQEKVLFKYKWLDQINLKSFLVMLWIMWWQWTITQGKKG